MSVDRCIGQYNTGVLLWPKDESKSLPVSPGHAPWGGGERHREWEGLWHLGGSVSIVCHFGLGHGLTVCEFKPRVGLCADSSEPGACFGFCVSLSLPLPHSLPVSLSQK